MRSDAIGRMDNQPVIRYSDDGDGERGEEGL